MDERGSVQKGLVVGAVMVLAGVTLLLERFGLLRFDLMEHFWPLMIAFIGGNLLLSNRSESARIFGLLLVLYSVVWELRKFHVIDYRTRDLWPVGLIVVGFFLLYRALQPPQQSEQPRSEYNENRLAEFAVFGGGEVNVTSQTFEGGSLTAVFGGYEVDFSHARLGVSPAIIYADAIFGGITLKVPQTWRVTASGSAAFGGFSNSALPPSESSEPEQHLVVKGTAIMGGVEVTNTKNKQ